MDFWPRLPDQPHRGVRFAYGYFVFAGLLVCTAFVASTTRILLDESLPRAEILLVNANIVLAGVFVPTLLLLAARSIRRGSRWGAGLAALGFILLALWVPKIGAAGVVVGVLVVVGLALTVTAWSEVTPRHTNPADVRAG
jgi:hypothetical protein